MDNIRTIKAKDIKTDVRDKVMLLQKRFQTASGQQQAAVGDVFSLLFDTLSRYDALDRRIEALEKR